MAKKRETRYITEKEARDLSYGGKCKSKYVFIDNIIEGYVEGGTEETMVIQDKKTKQFFATTI